MNRHVIVNSIIGLLVIGLVVTVFVLEHENSAGTEVTTTLAATTTTVVATTTTSTSTTSTTTTSTTTTTTTTVPPTTEVPLPRELWKVIVVNGSPTGERLQPVIDRLRELGYVDVRGLVGAVQTPQTVIYYAFPGQDNAADRLRADLELVDATLAPFDEAPPVAGRNDAQLMIYLGGR